MFSCDDGFVLKGSLSRTCLASGKWNGVNTFCQGIVRLISTTNVMTRKVMSEKTNPLTFTELLTAVEGMNCCVGTK